MHRIKLLFLSLLLNFALLAPRSEALPVTLSKRNPTSEDPTRQPGPSARPSSVKPFTIETQAIAETILRDLGDTPLLYGIKPQQLTCRATKQLVRDINENVENRIYRRWNLAWDRQALLGEIGQDQRDLDNADKLLKQICGPSVVKKFQPALDRNLGYLRKQALTARAGPDKVHLTMDMTEYPLPPVEKEMPETWEELEKTLEEAIKVVRTRIQARLSAVGHTDQKELSWNISRDKKTMEEANGLYLHLCTSKGLSQETTERCTKFSKEIQANQRDLGLRARTRAKPSAVSPQVPKTWEETKSNIEAKIADIKINISRRTQFESLDKLAFDRRLTEFKDMLEAVAKELEQNGSIPAGEKDKISKQIVILGEILKKERSFVKDQTANSFGYKGLGTELKHMLVELEKGAK